MNDLYNIFHMIIRCVRLAAKCIRCNVILCVEHRVPIERRFENNRNRVFTSNNLIRRKLMQNSKWMQHWRRHKCWIFIVKPHLTIYRNDFERGSMRVCVCVVKSGSNWCFTVFHFGHLVAMSTNGRKFLKVDMRERERERGYHSIDRWWVMRYSNRCHHYR